MTNFTSQEQVLNYLKTLCYSNYTKNEFNAEIMCEKVFDDLFCWPATKAGEVAVLNCSGELLKSSKEGIVTRQCTENGTWHIPHGVKSPYSNTTQCGEFFVNLGIVSIEDDSIYLQWLPIIKEISYCGYSLSIISLILSIYIFTSIKRLHCSRNNLHINLFISFILRAFMSVIKDSTFIRGSVFPWDVTYDKYGRPELQINYNYSWVCKAFISLRYYCIVSNFMFMLMEGVYLHNLMFLKFISDQHSVINYCILGWGLPIFFIVPWIVFRVLYENVMCWTRKENIYISLFIDVPIGITVVINFVLFLVIVKVLFIKLNDVCIQQKKFKYRKLLKDTLILIPLFGVPYVFSLLMSFYIEDNAVLEIFFLFFDQSFAAFQGFFASMVYCLLNAEVQTEIKRKYSLIKDKNDKEFRRSRTISNTQQISLNIFDDTPDTERIFTKENNQI
ncbi:parathyroid hormone/parathyroid hormone-related peptide receptor-like [Diorhabda sublineata]|uniref:parathyroid hormone/parathyroid hormone-related peptide receptor-like n=1 Tax=Diorhabda sublineata TaxID=1163346 RepID=UPI0024E18137|nr:parathyroid hormone/parathyroid hormone-related peptide receptor-like [Diorhabda sublineata]